MDALPYYKTEPVCVCGRSEEDHAPWAGECQGFVNSGSVRQVPITVTYAKVPIPEELRWEVFERDDFRCKHCGSRRMLRADHIEPEIHGGKMELANLQTLCHSCNSKKGKRRVDG